MKLSIIVVIFVLIVQCDAFIKCYSCQSNHDNRCADYFQLQTYDAVECQGTCIKRRGRRNNAVEITRECVAQTTEGCQDTTYDRISVVACTCNTDYCNLATNVCYQLPVLLITVISTFILRFFI